jgi:hypothetical protein
MDAGADENSDREPGAFADRPGFDQEGAFGTEQPHRASARVLKSKLMAGDVFI